MNNSADQNLAPKPYELISFPRERPTLAPPAGHDQYQSDRLHGVLHLILEVQTALHVSTGVVAMGSDVGKKGIPLIKTMTLNADQQLVIQGSSLKGCVRSIYEAITNSTLAVITQKKKDRNRQMKYYENKYPKCRKPLEINLKDSLGNKKLCPAGRIFGALNYQGLLCFSDALCVGNSPRVGFMPSLYSPDLERKKYYDSQGELTGRKFYYHMNRAIDPGENRGVPVQQAGRLFTFETLLHYKNLLPAELGILLIALGQDPQHPMALKMGGGKPIGMGTMTVAVSAIEQTMDVIDRYRQYDLGQEAQLTGAEIQGFMQRQIQAAYGSDLLQKPQLAELAQVLNYPSDRQPPAGMY
jgi:RAMP superfamily